MLAKDPRLRPSPENLLKNPFLAESHHLSEAQICPEVIGNLMTLHRETRFKKSIMQMISEKLPPVKIRDLENAFAILDASGDGFVTLPELKQYLLEHPQILNMKQSDVDKVFLEINDDDDNVISLQEFVIATLDTQHVL